MMQLKNDYKYDTKSNITITKARRYAAAIECKFKGGELTDHCGLFIYNNEAPFKFSSGVKVVPDTTEYAWEFKPDSARSK